MTCAVDLDRELRLSTVEVEHVGADGVLATEFEIGQGPPTQTDPEAGFRWRQGATLDPRSRDRTFGTQEPLHRFAVPLPIAPQRGGDVKAMPIWGSRGCWIARAQAASDRVASASATKNQGFALEAWPPS